MTYTINKLAKLAGVSVRTLHYYDEIGLLKPSFIKDNGYRIYEDKELITLQQILFFRELEFPLEEIKKMIAAPGFSRKEALSDQRKLLELKKDRIETLLKTIDSTIRDVKGGEKHMNNNNLYTGFNQDQIDQYKEEVQRKWGHTDAYKQSVERMKRWTKQDIEHIKSEGEEIRQSLANRMEKGVKDTQVQEFIARHHQHIEQFYDCSYEMYRALGQMYVNDTRFTATYDKVKPGLAQFVRDAIAYYCDIREQK